MWLSPGVGKKIREDRRKGESNKEVRWGKIRGVWREIEAQGMGELLPLTPLLLRGKEFLGCSNKLRLCKCGYGTQRIE